ncbi:MAG: trypsin-like peptidase domain-containing protein, partial [Gammaproteobacteria bacterium]|nr:trypsin-like peptidase domain-containing protein [Gammaproteobacteria bacterium]
RGYIVTNNHVVQRADEINVTLADGRTLQATLVGTDTQVDLAVLKVPPDSLSEIVFADSNNLRVGDFVVAIGNPFGLSQTVTSGIVSALGRILGIEGYEDFIQTDASINPGNSGGALVDLRGELVGINTAILAPSGGNVGIGFAIPANLVRVIMDQLIEHGQVRRGYLGLSVQALNPKLAEAFDVEHRQGVVVVEVEPGSAAEVAGLVSGDIITRIRDKQISRVADFQSQAAMIFVDDEVAMEVLRDGRSKRFKLELAEDKLENVSGTRIDARLGGTELRNFRNTEETAMGSGVLVTDVSGESPAAQYGLRAGDIIVEANRVAVGNLADLRNGCRRNSRQILLRIYRSGQYGYIPIR